MYTTLGAALQRRTASVDVDRVASNGDRVDTAAHTAPSSHLYTQ